MSRRHPKRNSSGRDGGNFVALPHVMLDSSAYQELSFSARALLVDVAAQYSGSNNGKLVLCDKALRPRGWKSTATIHKAKRELLDTGFLCETRKGYKPRRASWFAITWQTLDWAPEMDIQRDGFVRGAYQKINSRPPKNEVINTSTASNNEVIPPSITSENEAVGGGLGALPTSNSEEYLDIAIYRGTNPPEDRGGKSAETSVPIEENSGRAKLGDWISDYLARLTGRGLMDFCPVETRLSCRTPAGAMALH